MKSSIFMGTLKVRARCINAFWELKYFKGNVVNTNHFEMFHVNIILTISSLVNGVTKSVLELFVKK